MHLIALAPAMVFPTGGGPQYQGGAAPRATVPQPTKHNKQGELITVNGPGCHKLEGDWRFQHPAQTAVPKECAEARLAK